MAIADIVDRPQQRHGNCVLLRPTVGAVAPAPASASRLITTRLCRHGREVSAAKPIWGHALNKGRVAFSDKGGVVEIIWFPATSAQVRDGRTHLRPWAERRKGPGRRAHHELPCHSGAAGTPDIWQDQGCLDEARHGRRVEGRSRGLAVCRHGVENAGKCEAGPNGAVHSQWSVSGDEQGRRARAGLGGEGGRRGHSFQWAAGRGPGWPENEHAAGDGHGARLQRAWGQTRADVETDPRRHGKHPGRQDLGGAISEAILRSLADGARPSPA